MELLHNDRVDIRLYSPQALAFLGDAVYEILVRERIVHKANMPVNKLHLQAVEQVQEASADLAIWAIFSIPFSVDLAEASAAEAVASAEAASVEVWEVAEVPVPDSES